MADGTSSAEDSPDDDSNLSCTRTATGHRKRLDDDSDLGRTRTAKCSSSQTAAQREEGLTVERLGIFLSLFLLHIIHVPFHIIHH